LVSIVIATYNGSNFIYEQLSSILEQTYKNIEIIVIDDCSEDNTINIIKDTFDKNKFRNFHIFKNIVNVGPTRSFEKGILKSKGEYLFICDQDDIWYENKIETYLDVEKNTNADIVYSNSIIIKNNHITGSIFPAPQNFKTLFGILSHNNARGATIMIKKLFLEKIIPFSDLYDKWIFLVGCLYGKIEFINRPLQLYRIHENNYNAGRFRCRSKSKLLYKIKSNIEFYMNLLAFVQSNKDLNVCFCQNDVLMNISNIIKFYEVTIDCLNSKNINKRLIKYFKNVLGKEFTNIEKLIYFYYFVLKFR
jgi:glycosyltransferase involved in cell wall biosynthesis